MILFLHIILSLVLFIIVLQDFRKRAVLWFLFPLIFIVNSAIVYMEPGKEMLFINFSVNSIILLLHFIFITAYFSIKRRSFTNVINRFIGLGDILMLLGMTTLFSPVSFLLYIIVSLFACLGFALFGTITKRKEKTIPLAGIMALICLPVVLVNAILPANNILLNILTINVFL